MPVARPDLHTPLDTQGLSFANVSVTTRGTNCLVASSLVCCADIRQVELAIQSTAPKTNTVNSRSRPWQRAQTLGPTTTRMNTVSRALKLEC
eukprot:413264-Amphidinium_carterae.1